MKTIFLCIIFLFNLSFLTPVKSPPLTVEKKNDSTLFIFFDDCNKDFQKRLTYDVSKFYNLNLFYTKGSLPASSYYKPNKRYRADSILRFLSGNSKYKRVIALTDKPISATRDGRKDASILGLASPTNLTAIVSSAKLSFYDRCLYVLLHETAHTFGLSHCNSKSCFMYKGKSIIIPKSGLNLCNYCRGKINLVN